MRRVPRARLPVGMRRMPRLPRCGAHPVLRTAAHARFANPACEGSSMHTPIEAITAMSSDPATRAYANLAQVQPVDIAALARPGAADTPAGSAFASLAPPPPAPAFTPGAEWTRTLQTVGDAFTHGLNREPLKEMETLLQQSISSGQPASPEQLMLVGLKIQEGSAVSSFLSQAVNNTRQSLQTLVERS
jgi:hypothetical protein